MPTEIKGINAFLDAKILFAPAKAANAGGVAMSGLEMSQNAERRSWSQDELRTLLRDIMRHSRPLPRRRQGGGRILQLRQGCERGRLQEGGRRHAGFRVV